MGTQTLPLFFRVGAGKTGDALDLLLLGLIPPFSVASAHGYYVEDAHYPIRFSNIAEGIPV